MSRSTRPPESGAGAYTDSEALARTAARLAADLERVRAARIDVADVPASPTRARRMPSVLPLRGRRDGPLQHLARGTVSSAELVAAALDRIEHEDDHLRAWVALAPDEALAAAADADVRAARGERRSALEGVPIGFKDLIDTAGIATSYGSPIFAAHVPERDATVVARMRRAGAIVLGKTVTTQFATYDPGPTRNPWNLAHTPGGSSSGSAAAVAAGMVPIAVGTQTGGSTIRPASYCGVVGYLPTAGAIDRRGIFPCSWTLDRVGFFGRSVHDVADAVDAYHGHTRLADRAEPPTATRARIGIVAPLVARALPDMQRAVSKAGGLLAEAGAIVETIDVDFLEDLHATHGVVMRAEVAAVHEKLYARHAAHYAPEIASIVESGSRITAAQYLRALRLRRRVLEAGDDLLSRYDAMLAPAAVGEAEGSVDTIGDPVMNLFGTFMGSPVVAIPATLGDAGLPLGVQLIGRSGADARVLALAAALEAIMEFRNVPPGGGI